MPAAELTQRYVDCLEQFPALWDSRTRSYSNKDAKNAAWQSLANLIGVTVPEAQTNHKTNRTYFQKVCEVIYYLFIRINVLQPSLHGIFIPGTQL